MRRLLKLSKNELHKIAQLRVIDTTNVKKQDLIYMLLRSQSNVKESQYLSFLNQNTTNQIDNKINEIRKLLIQIRKRFTNKEITKYTQELYDIVKMLNSSHENRARYYSKLSNELKSLFNKIVNNRNIKKKTDLKKILDHLDKLLWNIKYKRKSHYITHDDDYHYGLKDLEKIFGDIDDYYKPFLATQSFYHKNPSTLNHQEYVCRETRESSQSIDDYLDKVQPHLVQLSKEKQVNELKIQLNLGVRLINEKDKKEFVYHVQTDNLKVLVTNEEIIVLYELFHNFKNKYQEGVNNIGQGSGYSYNGTEDLSINFRKIDLNRGSSYI